ncbi:MAG: bifunctional (p)ppGpp synthetase/guanosine-3',5'-bis(diphosphate) 3'-pyrophosphohydrolase [bacterium]
MEIQEPPIDTPFMFPGLEDDFPILELILRNYLGEEDILSVRRAFFFACHAHQGQIRDSGEPYITHPIAVAEILASFQLDAKTIMAGLLHDVLEDTDVTELELRHEFGDEVVNLVLGVTKVGKIGSVDRSEEEIENLRRMLLATAKDLRVIVIKLADRLHNLRTLEFLPRQKQIQIARNSMNIYAPLAHRLGLGRIKWELEDLCLMYIHPDIYQGIKKKVSLKRRERELYIKEIQEELERRLKEKGIQAMVEGRAKHFYSIYMKMARGNKSFEEIYDLIALRVICETIGECYAALGEVHTMWRQIEGRFKDYISTPKPNNYRSIHTTVLGPHGRMIEIQIRTQEMHYVAEHGIAAHWRYKESGKPMKIRDMKWLELFDQEQLPDTRDPEDFLQSIRNDLFSDEVYVYTPKGDLHRLPKDATPIDFAYKIHTGLGHRCGGAKVNGRLTTLNYSLQTGDVVEILTSPNSHPSPAWLDIVKTSSARNKIRRYLLESKREELLQMGQTSLTRELQRAGFNAREFYNSEDAKEICVSLGLKTVEDLFVHIGFGRISTKQVIARLLKKTKPEKIPERKEEERRAESRAVVKLADIDDILYRIARCCSPLPGDEIIGFVTRGRGVTIHKAACRNVKHFQADPGRILSLFWGGSQDDSISVNIEIVARDRRNLLSDLSQMISSTGTNIQHSRSDTVDSIATFYFTLEVSNTNHLNTIMHQLLGIEGVKSVRRTRESKINDSPKRPTPSPNHKANHRSNHQSHSKTRNA